MPSVEFSSLPATARIWIFASDRPLEEGERELLLGRVDAFLAQWKAHGAPLRCAREWRDDRFLAIGVDPTVEQASGCSIDGMFRVLQELERVLSTGLVAGGRVFYRDKTGQARLALRHDVPALMKAGELGGDDPVFDTTITNARDYRIGFERPARETWVASLLSPQASQPSSRSATNASSARKG